MIKAVIFDIDGVLVNSLPANFLWLSAILDSLGAEIKLSERHYRNHLSHMALSDQLRKFFPNRIHEIEELFDHAIKVDYPHHKVRVPYRSDQILNELAKKYKIGLVTNREKDGLDAYFARSNNRHNFAVVVGYEDFKNPKPHPEPLLIAASKLEVKPKEAVYVGDTWADVQAAKAAGMKIIAFTKRKLSDK
jgi:HAD superfamily hydrolase (TIGR01509 family)